MSMSEAERTLLLDVAESVEALMGFAESVLREHGGTDPVNIEGIASAVVIGRRLSRGIARVSDEAAQEKA